MLDRADVPLAPLTTLRLGGPARRLVTAYDEQSVVDVVRAADAAGEPLLVLGGGSNVVLPDEGFTGTVVRVSVRGLAGRRDGDRVLLAVSGLITAVPLLLFGAAASRVPLTTLGVLQYLAPTMQFLLGVTLFDEEMPPVKLAGFVLVWIALVLFTTDVVRHHRRQLRLAVPQPA